MCCPTGGASAMKCERCRGKGIVGKIVYGEGPELAEGCPIRVTIVGAIVDARCPRCRGTGEGQQEKESECQRL